MITGCKGSLTSGLSEGFLETSNDTPIAPSIIKQTTSCTIRPGRFLLFLCCPHAGRHSRFMCIQCTQRAHIFGIMTFIVEMLCILVSMLPSPGVTMPSAAQTNKCPGSFSSWHAWPFVPPNAFFWWELSRPPAPCKLNLSSSR